MPLLTLLGTHGQRSNHAVTWQYPDAFRQLAEVQAEKKGNFNDFERGRLLGPGLYGTAVPQGCRNWSPH